MSKLEEECPSWRYHCSPCKFCGVCGWLAEGESWPTRQYPHRPNHLMISETKMLQELRFMVREFS